MCSHILPVTCHICFYYFSWSLKLLKHLNLFNISQNTSCIVYFCLFPPFVNISRMYRSNHFISNHFFTWFQSAVSSAVPEVASVLSPPQLVGYPTLQKSPTSPTGSSSGHIDPEVFCPTSAAAAAAAAFSFPPYGSGNGGQEQCKTEDNKDN